MRLPVLLLSLLSAHALTASLFGGASAQRREIPIFEQPTWWSGETLSDEFETPPQAESLSDPCLWHPESTDPEECYLPPPAPLVDVDETAYDEVPDIPCITTDDGCSMEAAAGIMVE